MVWGGREREGGGAFYWAPHSEVDPNSFTAPLCSPADLLGLEGVLQLLGREGARVRVVRAADVAALLSLAEAAWDAAVGAQIGRRRAEARDGNL